MFLTPVQLLSCLRMVGRILRRIGSEWTNCLLGFLNQISLKKLIRSALPSPQVQNLHGERLEFDESVDEKCLVPQGTPDARMPQSVLQL